MKKIIILSGVIAALGIMSFVSKNAHTVVYKVDAGLSSLEWYAEKVTGKHNGIIKLNSGEMINDHGVMTGKFEINMNSIECKDLEGKSKAGLEKHLMSADFFDAGKFPKAEFVLTSIVPNKEMKEGGMTHTVTGNLTIKDKTNPISFGAIVKMEGNKIGCVGTAVVDRAKFDIKYNSKSFFPEIGDKMIYDEFQLKFNIIAVQ
jgi:polyisoprenoid-binding protein YceI